VNRIHMRSDMIPGAVFPDDALSDQTGRHRKLFELTRSMYGEPPLTGMFSQSVRP
jgi:hypothetical protein